MARNVTVTFADGSTHVYQNAPDNITPEQVSERAQREFGKAVSSLDGGKAAKESGIAQQVGNVAAGAVRGAGSIGATLMAPFDLAERGIRKVMGAPDVDLNAQRRADMTGALQSMGAEPESLAFKGGKLGAEIAGTMGVGGALAGAAPASLAAKAPALVEAVKTAGMSAAGKTGAAGLATRMAGGALTGGAAAGLVNPEDAGTGAAIGAALPPALQAAGKVGQAVGRVIKGPEQTPELRAAVQAARDAGYVIPPTQAKPTLGNRMLEGFAGKLTTAQNASSKNQAVTNNLAAKAIGLPADTKITPDVIKSVRDVAGQAYEAIGQSGTVTPGASYASALNAIEAPFKKAAQGFPNAKPSPVLQLVESLRSPTFDAASAVAKIKELRSAADDAFRAGNSDVGRASRAGAKALEDALESHLQQTGATDLLKNFRDARQLIAKTYTVEKALNPASGSVDARKLAGELKKGKPLSGDLKSVAEFASTFPKAAQAIEGMGSLPQTSPLDWAAGGIISAGMSNPLGLAGIAARPAARALTLSPMVQNRLIQQPNALQRMLNGPELEQFLLRAGPVAVSGR